MAHANTYTDLCVQHAGSRSHAHLYPDCDRAPGYRDLHPTGSRNGDAGDFAYGYPRRGDTAQPDTYGYPQERGGGQPHAHADHTCWGVSDAWQRRDASRHADHTAG